MTDQYTVTADELRQFVERIEAQTAVIKDETEARKEIFAEAKARGYDPKVLRRIVKDRARKPDEIAEEEAILDIYKSALGMA
jgi:uncharacterized protein (UPF0335 family)